MRAKAVPFGGALVYCRSFLAKSGQQRTQMPVWQFQLPQAASLGTTCLKGLKLVLCFVRPNGEREENFNHSTRWSTVQGGNFFPASSLPRFERSAQLNDGDHNFQPSGQADGLLVGLINPIAKCDR